MPKTETHKSAAVEDEAQYRPSKRGAAHERLEPFVGKWTTEGNAYDSPFGPAARVTAAESYEWLTGGTFLVHRLQGRLGGREMACLEVIGYDGASEAYPVRSFYNDRTYNLWQAQPGDTAWTFTGDWQSDGRMLTVRCTLSFGDDGRTRTGRWDYSTDGTRWERFWDTRSVRS
jgi:hypothetical protein